MNRIVRQEVKLELWVDAAGLKIDPRKIPVSSYRKRVRNLDRKISRIDANPFTTDATARPRLDAKRRYYRTRLKQEVGRERRSHTT